MKAVILIIISLVLQSTSTFAYHENSVERLLPNIRDRVRNCTILPYLFNEHQMRVEHALRSHCPEVKVLSDRNGAAKIRVAGHQFIATLIETEFSDGDIFDVEISDIVSGDTFRFQNVLAFGDILLGVLEGNTQGVSTSLVNE
jgi:hypothetical protein